MNEKERHSPDSSQRRHGGEFEDPGERRSDKSPFQWALEVQDLLDKQKPKHDSAVGLGVTEVAMCQASSCASASSRSHRVPESRNGGLTKRTVAQRG